MKYNNKCVRDSKLQISYDSDITKLNGILNKSGIESSVSGTNSLVILISETYDIHDNENPINKCISKWLKKFNLTCNPEYLYNIMPLYNNYALLSV